MFVISSPITTPDSTSKAVFTLSSTPGNYATTAVLENPHPVDSIIPTTPPAIVDGVIVIPAPPDVRVRTLTIGGITYNYTLISPPPAGYFTEIDGSFQIGYVGLVPPVSIGYYLAPIKIDTNFIAAPYPDLFTQFPLTGEISWTLNWEEQPSATFTFITDARERQDVIDYFTANHNFDIYGVGFATSGQLSITEISLTKSAIPLIKVDVTLTGVHAKYLELYTFLGQQLFLPDCKTPPIRSLNSPTEMTVQDLALKVGTSVIGEAISIDRNILNAPAVATNLGSNLDSSSIRGVGAFVDYHHAAGIKLKSYQDVPSHRIETVKSDIQTSVNHKIGSNYYKTYDPLTKVTFGANPYTKPTNREKPKWQPVPQVETTTYEGDENPSISPYFGTQKDLSIVFDISGKRKRQKRINLINGQPIRETEVEYGYVAVGKDHIEFNEEVKSQIDKINGSWRRIASKTTDYSYDGLGYLTSVQSRGYRLTRYRTENAQKPESLAVRIADPNPDPGEVAQLKTFRFFELNVSTSETYKLELMSNYYSDIKTPKVNYTICLADGSGTFDIPIDDKAYIPPYFVKSKRTVERGSSSTDNPKSTALKPLPPLTTGKSSEFVERIVVDPKPLFSQGSEDPTYYTKSTDNYSAEGAQFGSVLSIAESQLINGRPPVATNRGAILELVKPPTATKSDDKPIVPFAVKSGLTNENLGYVTVGSLNFPTAATQSQALLAARIDIDLINTKNTQTETLTIEWNPKILPGDKIDYRVGSGPVRLRRVISVTQKLTIEGRLESRSPFVTSAGTTVKLGVDAKTPVELVNLPTRTTTINL